MPANEIIGLDPGEVFVDRNIANLAPPQDANYLSVLQFAVETLKVQHILVVGHYGCGGVAAAVDGKRRGLIDHWCPRSAKSTTTTKLNWKAWGAGALG